MKRSNKNNGKRVYKEKNVKKNGGARALKNNRRMPKPVKVLLTIFIVMAAITLAVFIAYKAVVKPPELPSVTGNANDPQPTDHEGNPIVTALPPAVPRESEHVYTFLICGTDAAASNTDTIMVAKYDVDNQIANVMSIPRDTMINVTWGIKKINAAYPTGGVERLQDELAKLLGFKIDYYIVVDLEAFVKIVDTIGGVDFNIPERMYYYDPTPGKELYIDFQPGPAHLSGADALKVVRYRKYANADIGRIAVQQDFLKALAKQTLKLSNITKVDKFASIFSEYVETNLTVGNIAWLAQNAMSMDTENINFMTLPGNYSAYYKGQSYVTVYVNELLEMVNTYLNPMKEPVTASNLDILTKDSGGNLYATTGTIRGGLGSFTDFSGSSGGNSDSGNDDEPVVIEEPAEPTEPVETEGPTEPVEIGEPTEPVPTDEPAEPTEPVVTDKPAEPTEDPEFPEGPFATPQP
ncbi:MAG: LCP family protein [Oscillospiraceae bacterium]|jgi:LCP family protein required for cell wall assembly